ncbi:MAG: hypothetical protein JWN56_178 [Sphingobacteriales bacterium]|nr:hypothetical protein [Sphingobacteriales bacterium]
MRSQLKHWFFVYFIVVFNSAVSFAQTKDAYPFESEIKSFHKQDSLHAPQKGGILFIGSSSIRKWTDLEDRFPDKKIIKRGVGGSEIWQLNQYYTKSILLPYKPSKIFLYAGENDIASGRTALQVYDEFRKFWSLVKMKLPKAQVYYLSIKPSPSRAKYHEEFAKANNLIRTFLKDKSRGHFIDMGKSIVNADGSADLSLYESDHLHLNNKGYDRWEKVLKPFL